MKLIKESDSLDFTSNIAGEMGMDIEVDTKGLNDKEIDKLRDTMYPKVIKSFQKHSKVMEGLLNRVLDNIGNPSTLGGYLKCIYCRVKSNVTNTGAGISEIYSRELVTGIIQKIEEKEPKISYKSNIEVLKGKEKKKIPIEVDELVLKEFCKYMKEPKAKERIKTLAQRKIEFDIEQLLPIKDISKMVIAKFPTPDSIDLGKSDFGLLKDRNTDFPTASITVQICYEDEGCLCSYCNEYTIGIEETAHA